MSEVQKIFDAIAFLALVTEIVTHSKGFTKMVTIVTESDWEMVYYRDWDYHASKFID